MKFRLGLGLGLKPALPAHVVPLLPVLARRHRTHLARKLHQHGLCDDLVSSVKVAVVTLLAACQEKKGATRRGKTCPPRSLAYSLPLPWPQCYVVYLGLLLGPRPLVGDVDEERLCGIEVAPPPAQGLHREFILAERQGKPAGLYTLGNRPARDCTAACTGSRCPRPSAGADT